MRLLSVLLLIAFSAIAIAQWSAEDHEIFRLREELIKYEGANTTFYSFMGGQPSSSTEELHRLFRKTSARLHPDKFKPNPQLTRSQNNAARKLANERYARLGVIAKLMAGPQRDRYDHFLKNGFPKYKKGGYAYERFRPGMAMVLLILWGICGATHYVILKGSESQHRKHMQRIIDEARNGSWGATAAVPRIVELDSDDSGSERRKPKKGAKADPSAPKVRKYVADNGKVFMVQQTGEVFLVDGNEEFLLDLNDIPKATLGRTCLVTWPRGIYNVTLGRVFGRIGDAKPVTETDEEEEEEEEAEEATATGASATKKATSAKKGVAKKIEKGGDGMPRRRTKTRAAKKEKE